MLMPLLTPQATRTIHELLLGPSRHIEVQSFFCPLFMALLLQVSCLVGEWGADIIQEQRLGAQWVDPVRYLWSLGCGC